MAETIGQQNVHLENVILQMEKELEALQTSARVVPPASITEQDPEDSETGVEEDDAVTRAKCKQMAAEITQLKSTPLTRLPETEEKRYQILQEDLQQRVLQLRQCCSFIQAQRKQVIEDIDREKKVQSDLEDTISVATRKLQGSDNDHESQNEVHQRIETKCSTLDTVNTNTLKDMSDFLDEHFPLPDRDAFNKVKKKLDTDTTRLATHGDLLPLKSIVETLMNACLDSPNDPYITTDHRHWPPYVELLLQCDIAVRHPSDSRKLKLMPFHL